jgi:hypothetical protein
LRQLWNYEQPRAGHLTSNFMSPSDPGLGRRRAGIRQLPLERGSAGQRTNIITNFVVRVASYSGTLRLVAY